MLRDFNGSIDGNEKWEEYLKCLIVDWINVQNIWEYCCSTNTQKWFKTFIAMKSRQNF
jgi:hypothetical protein